MSFGIYQIRNTVNGKVYIGSTVRSFKKRWKEHKTDLNSKNHHSLLLQRAWDKYGKDCFAFEILEILIDKDATIDAEQKHIDSIPEKMRYNMCSFAGSTAGRTHSEETRIKLSIIGKGRPHTKEHSEKIAASLKGIIRPPEVISKVSSALKGRKLSEKELMSLVLLHESNKGRVPSEEHRIKISNSLQGHFISEETRTKIGASHRGKTNSPEARIKIGLANKGKNRAIDLVGQRFGWLTVIKRAGNHRDGHAMWLCLCDCGNKKNVRSVNLKNGSTQSCGCWRSGLKRERMIRMNSEYVSHS
jgi:group I intron endonuclease